jgi:hypothetical protein
MPTRGYRAILLGVEARVSRIVVVAVGASVALAVACSQSSSSPSEASDPTIAPNPTNPDGVAYPTDNIGSRARAGTVRGDRIENFAFQGYDHSNVSGGLKQFSMADFYDPKAAHWKTIVISGAATWCSACGAEADIVTANAAQLEKEGVVILSVMTAGPSAGYGPSLSDVTGWIADHKTNYTTLIDVRARRLATVGLTGVPWSALIDPRTMEILFASDGAPDDYVAFARLGENFVATHPPSY